MELGLDKRQLLTQQHEERATLLAALEYLDITYQKDLEHYRRKARQKSFTHEITRAHRYKEEKSIWEYLNNIVEDVHLYTWRKTVIAQCTSKYERKRMLLNEELRDLETQHRKERINLRYKSPPDPDEPITDYKS